MSKNSFTTLLLLWAIHLLTVITCIKSQETVNCKLLANGEYEHPTERCTNKYFLCVNEKTIPQMCPRGLYFNARHHFCDARENIKMCLGKKGVDAKSSFTDAGQEYNCADKMDGVYAPDYTTCPYFYYQCSNGYTYKFDCPSGLYFDSVSRVCDRFFDIRGCSNAPQIPLTTPPSIRRTGSTVASKIVESLDCSKMEDGNYALGQCLNYYFVCVARMTLPYYCPAGLYYDSKMDRCDHAYNMPKCKNLTTVQAPTTSKKVKRRVSDKDSMVLIL